MVVMVQILPRRAGNRAAAHTVAMPSLTLMGPRADEEGVAAGRGGRLPADAAPASTTRKGIIVDTRDPEGSGLRRTAGPDPAPGDPETVHMLRRYGKELALKSLLLDSVRDGVVAHTLDGHLVYCNEAAYEQLGFTREDFDEIGPWGWTSPEARAHVPERTREILENGSLMFASTAVTSAGDIIDTEVHARAVETPYGVLAVAIIRDVTERRRAEAEIRHLAFFDRLTDLPNRAKLEDDLRHAIADAGRHRDVFGAVYIDLDDFKPVNDKYGHAVGDRVLLEVAGRLRSGVREGDTVARLGGDEFVVLALRIRSAADLGAIGHKLEDALSEPMTIDGRTVHVTASVGLALYEPGETAEDLLARADHGMYRAKQEGIRGWRPFTDEAPHWVR